MRVRGDSSFCGEHQVFDPRNSRRVPCPYDPKQYSVPYHFLIFPWASTVDLDSLKDHLKRCNSRPSEQAFFELNINNPTESQELDVSGALTTEGSSLTDLYLKIRQESSFIELVKLDHSQNLETTKNAIQNVALNN